jgi:hypothetical protein
MGGVLTAAPATPTSSTQRALIGSVLTSTGCSTYGSLGFVEGPSTNRCARYSTFSIQSNQENSQLGAKLSFNSLGGFYACGAGQDVSAENIHSRFISPYSRLLQVWYQTSSSDAPGGLTCVPVDLWTVPVA